MMSGPRNVVERCPTHPSELVITDSLLFRRRKLGGRVEAHQTQRQNSIVCTQRCQCRQALQASLRASVPAYVCARRGAQTCDNRGAKTERKAQLLFRKHKSLALTNSARGHALTQQPAWAGSGQRRRSQRCSQMSPQENPGRTSPSFSCRLWSASASMHGCATQ